MCMPGVRATHLCDREASPLAYGSASTSCHAVSSALRSATNLIAGELAVGRFFPF